METETLPRPEKRQRSESSPEQDGQPRRSSVWLEDGNIVLEAQSVEFRVHKSILATNSQIFRDMFQMAQPSSQRTVEGVPVVEMHDSPDDVQCMLTALYDRT